MNRFRTALLVVIAASAIQGAQTLAYSQGAPQATPPAAYQRRPEMPRSSTGDAEAIFGPKFWAEFIRDALAAIAGAGVGSWLGARFAFDLERRKAGDEHREAAEKRKEALEEAAKRHREESEATALDLAERRATAGNLAVFTLAQIYNDLLAYERQFMVPANKSDAAWFWLVPSGITDRSFYRFDVPSLAFLLQSRKPGAPEMLMKLALEQDRYAAFLDTVQRRAAFHEQHIQAVIERLEPKGAADRKYTDAELREAAGPRVYATLRNYFVDIETLMSLGLQSSRTTGDALRALLVAELPRQTIIGFVVADEAVQAGKGSTP
jgi:hypothetical protein